MKRSDYARLHDSNGAAADRLDAAKAAFRAAWDARQPVW